MKIDPEYEQLLRSRGATEDEIAEAARGGQHFLNALNTELVVTPRGHLDAAALAQRVDVSVEQIAAWWRALGLPDPRLAGTTLNDADVATAQTAAVLASFVPPATLDDLLRVFGASTRQVANAGVNALRVGFEQPLRRAGTSDAGVSQAYDIVVAALPGVAEMFDALMRRFIVESVYEQVAVNEKGAVQTLQTIVFVDLVDFTGLAQRLEPADLARMLSAYEGHVGAVAHAHGGRLVKLLGDGAMVSFTTRAPAIAAARDLVRPDESLPPRRAGLATGAVLTRQGDFYGEVVNLAARLSGVVDAGEVAVDGSLAIDDAELMPATHLKGIAAPIAYYRVR